MATENETLLAALEELEAVGINTISNDSWTDNTITLSDSTSAGDLQVDCSGNILLDNGSGIGEWYTGVGGQTTLQMGALTLTPQENGDVEIIMEADGLREEYHINADKVRNFLRSIADVVVEGRET